MTEYGSLNTTEILKNSIEAIRKGDFHIGRKGLIWLIQRDRTNIQAWLWLAYTIDEPQKKLDCYRNVIAIDPENETARKAIAFYSERLTGTPTSAITEEMNLIDNAHIKQDSKVSILSKADTVSSRLDKARNELLDLSLFNRLLNYYPLKSKGIEIVNGKAVDIFRILVQEGRSMSFLPERKDESKLNQAILLDEEPERQESAISQPEDEEDQLSDYLSYNKLQTSYTSEALQRRLLNTYYAYRTYIEEQGVNVLFLAIGMLHWYESPSSNEVRSAPIILIPVELDRSNIRSKFNIRHTEDDIGDNLSLRAKLSSDFGIKLPDFPDSEEFEVGSYLGKVAKAVRHIPRWKVDPDAIVLGFFSFGKFLMFHDLKPGLWPEDSKPPDHPILNDLLGNGFDRNIDLLADEVDADTYLSPEDTNHILDADSSQTIAILEAGRGRNLVIQGPPGTGKSQTIANVIAEAISNGKKVLFVAEKMAALEVVKRRLDNVGLGDACLELHSHKTNKKVLLNELKRILELGQPKIGKPIEMVDLRRNRERLNAYCREINEVIGESQITPYEIYGKLILLKERLLDKHIPEIIIPGIEDWSNEKFQIAISTVEELQVFIQRIGRPIDHPFWGCEISILLPSEQERVDQIIQDSTSALFSLGEQALKTAKAILIPIPNSQDDVRKELALLNYLRSAPPLASVNVSANAWVSEADYLEEIIQAGQRLTNLRDSYKSTLRTDAWTQDVYKLREILYAYSSKWWRAFSHEYRSTVKQIKELCQGAYPKNIRGQIAIIDAILEVQNLVSYLQSFDSTGSMLFGEVWRCENSDWILIREIAVWLRTLYENIQKGELPPTTLKLLKSLQDFSPLENYYTLLEQLLSVSTQSFESLVAALHLNESVRFGEGRKIVDLSFADQAYILSQWSREIGRLHEIATLSVLICRIDEIGLQPFITPALLWAEASHHLVDLLHKAWLTALLQRAFIERSILAQFDGNLHDHILKRFCELDLALLYQNRIRLAYQHWASIPRYEARGQLGILKHEFAKKKRHRPIRKLMAEAGNVIQVLKPIFMMSPLSVALYLPPSSAVFDIVIFDEASQVKPVEAFGAILRGNQLIVVGDERQLPPTTFFETGINDDEDYSESFTVDIESILGLCIAQGMPQRMLRWHYRSQHESLITVSNYEFYDNKLTVFPSPETDRRTVGLIYHYLPQSEYGRGGSRKNIVEARAVAEAVMEHAYNFPDLTLGVAAFSFSQMEAIRDQLEILRRSDISCEPFFRSHPEEPFFIKNLENVQGDERDVIFISVGYGRTADGKISMSFGPLNAEGGERRLNVLITRAKKRCEIFTNLKADDIDLSRTNARGVQVLKRFLKYAETGLLDMPQPSEREVGSPFEEAVASHLRRLGYRVQHQVGTGGFFIDLAVVDESAPGRYQLGIECDGATYHSARSARDRDRLRQSMLEALGWRIHRIWSTDWFRNPEREMAKLQDSISAAQTTRRDSRGQLESSPDRPVAFEITREDAHSQVSKRAVEVEPYSIAHLRVFGYLDNLHEASPSLIAEWIKQVVTIESPVHEDEVLRRIANGAGVQRIGTRIESAFRNGLLFAVNQGLIKRKGIFLWNPKMQRPNVRSRATLPNSSRKIELIAPEEFSLATSRITEAAYGITREDLARAVCEIFGFERATEGMLAIVDNVISRMLADGNLNMQGKFIVVETNI